MYYNIFMSLSSVISTHGYNYPMPMNMSYHWSYGTLMFMFLVFQMVTGFFLASHYIPNEYAFNSVEHMMSDLNKGWLMSYSHANGITFIFFFLYYHMASAMYYNLYEYKKLQVVWFSGFILYVLMMATTFLGYVLPWGQMSFRGATVMTNLMSVMPYMGEFLVNFLWGGTSVTTVTLNSFFCLHFMLPFLILALAFLHLMMLHDKGSSNSLMMDNKNVMNFVPYYLWKGFFLCSLFIVFFVACLGFFPNEFLHNENYMLANELVTPAHLTVEWYFAPFYTMLSAMPDKLGGILMLMMSLVWMMLLPKFVK